MNFHEAHVERLLGRVVVDLNGEKVGRLEEMIVEVVDGEHVVTEFHIGGGAMIERIAAFVRQLPFFSRISSDIIEVRWRDLDLSDPRHPRLRLAKQELRRVPRPPAS